jgi:hypothetical protein
MTYRAQREGLWEIYNRLETSVLVCTTIWLPFGGKSYRFLAAMTKNCKVFYSSGWEKLASTDINKLKAVVCPISQRLTRGNNYYLHRSVTTLVESLMLGLQLFFGFYLELTSESKLSALT